MAHLDLHKGPLVLHVPKITHHRYYVFEFLDPYTNVFHYVGTRTTGDGAGNFVIVGPRFHAKLPAGLHVIRAATRTVLALRSTLVYGPSDLTATHQVQRGYKLVPAEAVRESRPGLQSATPGQDRHHAHRLDDPHRLGVLRRPRRPAPAQPATTGTRRSSAN